MTTKTDIRSGLEGILQSLLEIETMISKIEDHLERIERSSGLEKIPKDQDR